MTFGGPIPLGNTPGYPPTPRPSIDLIGRGVPPVHILAPEAAAAAINNLTQSLREKDDVIQAQYAELTEARRQLTLLREAVEHWKAKAEAA